MYYFSFTVSNSSGVTIYKFPFERVNATYSLFKVTVFSVEAENVSSIKFFVVPFKITHAASYVSPFEYDQFTALNEYRDALS